MANIYIFLFDLDYGVEETYQEVVQANNIQEAWDKIKTEETGDPGEPTYDHDKSEVDQVIELLPNNQWEHWAYNSNTGDWELGYWSGHKDGINKPFRHVGPYNIK